MKEKFNQSFLGYKITNTWNSDGYVLHAISDKPEELFRCHLGNYHELDGARQAALFYFMLERPNSFSAQLRNRVLFGCGCSHEFYKLKKVLLDEGHDLPDEVTAHPTTLCIDWNKEPFGEFRHKLQKQEDAIHKVLKDENRQLMQELNEIRNQLTNIIGKNNRS